MVSMRITSVLLVASSALAYQVTFPGDSRGWTTAGPNYLKWQRVDTDPLNFTVFLTNQNIGYSQILDTNVDGTLGSVMCSKPTGGWPSGSAFRVNLAQDANHPNSLLAQSNDFDITAAASNGSTASASIQMSTATTATSSIPSISSSDTSTTPTGASAASLGADTPSGLFTAVAGLTALFATLF